jgi:hypothetical protein
MALRASDVSRVGTRCSILILLGDSEDDAIILQQKEASINGPWLDSYEHTENCIR